MKKLMIAMLASLSVAGFVQAANVASDDASDAAYNDGWQAGDNGGSGFAAWTLQTTSGNGGENGHFIGSSVGNGNTLDDGTVAGTASDGDIDVGGEAWGLYANSGQTAGAIRGLTGGSLSVGQTISLSFDNGFIDNGSTVGFGLQNSSGQNVFELFFVGGNPSYNYVDNGGSTAMTTTFGDEGLDFTLTLTSATTYNARLTRLDGNVEAFSGTLATQAGGTQIDQIRLFNFNAGGGGAFNLYGNSLAVVPEPSTMVLAGLGIAGLLFRRRMAK